MKKILFPFLFVLVFTGQVMSQKQLYFGISGTGLSPWITNQNNYGDPELDYKLTFGFGVNANIGFDFNKHLGAKIEAGFQRLGQDYEDTRDGDTTFTRDIQLNYFTLPVLFKYKSSGSVARFYFLVGPQFNFLTSAKQKYYRQEEVYSNEIVTLNGKPVKIGEEDITVRYNSMDIMARLDAGVDITIIPSLFLNVGLTFAYGLTDINASDYQLPDHSGAYHASHNLYPGMNFGINYVLPIGKKE